ncbi:UDP-N-acetylglucosamine 2-epimerase (non-hydrolyzing) [Oscillospiraceae bacterium OttesenSCG-928-F05]|nr:UDP-N-acetylglucosamine 2-epimerase (non-hydrolyzing) [Oscillospiraceae bacterium OttesenSCG-928-F05]
MKKVRVLSVFGTRPEAIKMAPLVLELGARPGIESIVAVTGQHRQMLDAVLDLFGIRADYDLNIMQPKQTLYSITSRTLLGMERVLEEAAPDIVLVHGDTSTTFAGALSAFYAQVPVGHVEAGLRTYDNYSPFPEEMNRRLVGPIAALHFCPTRANAENLARESITDGIFITGNTAIDALKTTVKEDYTFRCAALNAVDFARRRVILVTAHRRENYGEPLENIFMALRALAENYADVEMVYPVHMSPVVTETAKKILGNTERVHLIPPVDVDDMHNAMARSFMVMTDSGGIQEESPALGKPVLVLRRETERPEAVRAGTVKIAGVERETIYAMAAELLDRSESYAAMANAVNPYGDGAACRRIADAIEWHFGLRTARPEEFSGV